MLQTLDISSSIRARRGFTLMELMVSMVIISILSSLMLAGMLGVRQRAKIDKTKSTIRKINELVVPRYEDYLRRRVPFAAGSTALEAARNRLLEVRRLMMREMPDAWGDVYPGVGAVPAKYAANGTVLAYAAYRASLPANHAAHYGSAECLHMTIAFGGVDPDAMETFRSDEIGDLDGDGAPEFLDGWGRPIAFLRWAPGFTSVIQAPNPIDFHDPFDSQRVEAAAFALTPLIFSPGPDESLNPPTGGADGYGLARHSAWSGLDLLNIFTQKSDGQLPGEPKAGGAADDNITNHDLVSN